MAEVEAKFLLTPEAIQDLLVELGDPHALLDQQDTYFNTPEGYSLRIREEFNRAYPTRSRAYLTLKGIADNTTDGIRAVEEIEPEISPDDVRSWSLIFQRMGLSVDIVVKKLRQEYKIDLAGYDGKLMIDLVENLGYFCELEILDDDEHAARIALAESIIELGLDNLATPNGSYRYLLKATNLAR